MPLVSLFETELGWFGVAGGNGCVEAIVIGRGSPVEARADVAALVDEVDIAEADWFPELREKLESFAAGEVVHFDDVPVAMRSRGGFGARVVAATRRIPYGETRSYGELAAEAGSPRAARAVGRVMSSNRFPIVVPCHRVVGSGGRLGGFSAPGGIRVKSRLLEMEAAATLVPR